MSGWDGRPDNPERGGWHVIRCCTGDACGVQHFYWVPADEWGSDVGGWTVDALQENAHIFTDFEDNGYRAIEYLGPCLTPTEVAAQVAAAAAAMRARCAIECCARGEKAPEIGDDWGYGPAQATSLAHIIAALPLPHGDALAAAVAQAEERGAKREREACAADVERVAHEKGRAECCGAGIGGYGYSPPECCGDPIYTIDGAVVAAAIRARGEGGGDA